MVISLAIYMVFFHIWYMYRGYRLFVHRFLRIILLLGITIMITVLIIII